MKRIRALIVALALLCTGLVSTAVAQPAEASAYKTNNGSVSFFNWSVSFWPLLVAADYNNRWVGVPQGTWATWPNQTYNEVNMVWNGSGSCIAFYYLDTNEHWVFNGNFKNQNSWEALPGWASYWMGDAVPLYQCG